MRSWLPQSHSFIQPRGVAQRPEDAAASPTWTSVTRGEIQLSGRGVASPSPHAPGPSCTSARLPIPRLWGAGEGRDWLCASTPSPASASLGRNRGRVPVQREGTGPGSLPRARSLGSRPRDGGRHLPFPSKGRRLGAGPGPHRARADPGSSLTCAHAGSSRSSPAPALRPSAWAQACSRPWAGARSGRPGAGDAGLARGWSWAGAGGAPGLPGSARLRHCRSPSVRAASPARPSAALCGPRHARARAAGTCSPLRLLSTHRGRGDLRHTSRRQPPCMSQWLGTVRAGPALHVFQAMRP